MGAVNKQNQSTPPQSLTGSMWRFVADEIATQGPKLQKVADDVRSLVADSFDMQGQITELQKLAVNVRSFLVDNNKLTQAKVSALQNFAEDIWKNAVVPQLTDKGAKSISVKELSEKLDPLTLGYVATLARFGRDNNNNDAFNIDILRTKIARDPYGFLASITQFSETRFNQA